MSNTQRNSDAFSQDEMGDFIIRRRILPVWQLVLLFLLSFSILFVVTTNAEMLGGAFGIGLAIFAVIGPLTWFTVYFSQQNRDMLLAAEFQNALFSAAARLKSTFVMIVKQDGTIFYFDRGFQKVFPETSRRGTLMIDKLFSSQQISKMESEKLLGAIEQGRAETVFVHLQDANGKSQKVIINIDPLPRPSGFYIIRGRDYVVKRYERNTTASAPALPLVDNPQLNATMSHMLHTLPYGIYTTDANGTLLFANYRLESWLGYNQNEIITNKLTLAHIVAEQNTALVDDLLLRNTEGELQFKSKDGQAVLLHVQQEICKDANGNIVGSVMMLQPEQHDLSGVASRSAIDTARKPESPDELPQIVR